MSAELWHVRVHVIEGRDIKGKGDEGLSDPMVSVEMGSNKQYTQQFEDTASAIFDRLFMFDFTAPQEDMETKTIEFFIWDANTVTSNVLIGSCPVDLGVVYKTSKHAIFNQWLALVEPGESDVTETQAYLKVSVSVVRDGESHPVPPPPGDDDDSMDPSKMVLNAPSLKQEGYHLYIRIFKAENLPKTDYFSKADAYVQVKFAGNPVQKTKIAYNELNPVWNTELRLPVMVPVMANAITVEVMDTGRLGSALGDRVIGKFSKKFNDLLLNDLPPTWFNLYGHPSISGAAGKIADIALKILDSANILSEVPESFEKSAYCGRILVSMEVEKAPKPKLGSKAIQAAQPPKSDNFVIWFDLMEAAEMNVNEWLFNSVVELVCGDKTLMSKPASVKDSRAQWYQSFDEIAITLPVDITHIHDLFINIYKEAVIGDRSRFGFLRIKFSDVFGFEKPPKWYVLSPDPTRRLDVGAIPGYLQFSLQIGREREKPAKGRKKIRKPPMMPFVLRVHLFQARHLIAADESGTSDPYVVVRFGGISDRTQPILNTCFPIFNQTLSLDVEVPDPITLAPEINVMVFDYDWESGDDLIGRVTIPAHKVKPDLPRYPKWRKLYLTNPNKPQGEILISFQLFSKSQIAKYPEVRVQPQTRDCIVEITCIGVRDLSPYMLQDVQDPIVEFDAGDATPEKIKSTRIGVGPNSNFLQILTMPQKVPVQPLFAPYLNIKCYDNRMLGKALVGSSSVYLGKYIPWPWEPVDEINSDEEEVAKNEVKDMGDRIPTDMSQWNLIREPEIDFTSPVKAFKKGSRVIGDVSETNLDQDGLGDNSNERQKVEEELEKMFKKPPFEDFQFKRGDATQSGGGQQVGVFKARVRILELAKRSMFPPPIDVKEVFRPRTFEVRVYVLRGLDLSPMDNSGYSDPYTIIKLGDKTDNHVDSRQEQTVNPDLFVRTIVKAKLPGTSSLTIEVWDFDQSLTHDLIGSTRIDLETRVFSDEWNAMRLKPIEYRTLTRPTQPNAPQGRVEMWVDVLSAEEALTNLPLQLERPVPAPFVLRVVVWKCRGIVNSEEETTDAYISGRLMGVENANVQETDVHWKSSDEKNPPEFNWRFIFPLELFENMDRNPRLQLAIWDQDIVGANDAMGECIMSLKPLYKRAMKSQASAKMEKMWVKCTHPNFEGVRGEICVDLEVLPKADHDLTPVGKGRDPPNESPFLPTPNRPSLIGDILSGLNPFSLFGLKRKLQMCCAMLIIAAVIIVVLKFAV